MPFHAAPLGEAQAQMQIYDFDGDGDADILGSSAHKRASGGTNNSRKGNGRSTRSTPASPRRTRWSWPISTATASPTSSPASAYYAHNGRDPGEDEPPVIAWYELSRKDGKPVWTQHAFDHDSGVGTAFEVHDMNGDGLQDVIVANKRGVFYFEQTRE